MSGSEINSDGRVGSGLLTHDQWQRAGEALGLTPRELQIVQCMFDDASEDAIAQRLGTSRNTVHTQIVRLFRKLNVNSKCDLLIRVFAVHIEASQSRVPESKLDVVT